MWDSVEGKGHKETYIKLVLAMKNQMSSKSQGWVAYFSKKNTSLKYKKVTLSDALIRQHCAVHHATAISSPNAIALPPAAHCAAGAHCRSGGAEIIILSVGGAKSMILSACAESIILSAPPSESMMLSA